MKKAIIVVVILAIGFAAFILLSKDSNSPQVQSSPTPSVSPQVNFIALGNLVESAAKNGWSILYEEPGKPALKSNLVFNNNSACVKKGVETACSTVGQNIGQAGDRIKAEGVRENNSISVLKLTTMQTNKNGVLIETVKPGDGQDAKNGDKVKVHYTGKFENGQKFDSSRDRGTPFSFTLGAGQVIKGWDIGVLGMKTGEQAKLIIPSDLGYGAGGVPGAILPNSTLIFDVELLEISE